MKKITNSITTIAIASLVGILAGPLNALAATDPGLGAAASFSILAQTGITGTGTISGNVENNGTGAAITALTTAMVGGTIYSSDAVATLGAPPAATTLLNAAVQANALAAYTTNIPGQILTSNQGPILDGLTLTPGVYNIGAGRLNGGVLTLNGPGVYIFRASSDFVSSGSINFINGARACDVYWRVETLATINGSSFAGTILAGTGVHFGANVTLNGRALAIGTDVTMINDIISGPTCATPPSPSTTGRSGSPYFPILPAITITKVPSPLSLPTGPGPVTYTYVVTNSGKVPLNTVWVKDNMCSPVQYVSGDTNKDGMLDLTETWTYDCFKTLSQTETNTATAHGYGIGLGMDVYATAVATVVVSIPVSIPVQGQVLGIATTTIPVPSFPNAGLPPREVSSPWNIILSIGIFVLLATVAVVFSKRTG